MVSVARKVFSLSLILIFGLVATGCSRVGNNQDDKIQIRIWRTEQDIDTLRNIIKEFQKDHSDAEITFKRKSEVNYEVNALKSLASRQGPDIWSVPNDWLGDVTDITVPLPDNFFYPEGDNDGKNPTEAVKELFPPGIIEQITRPDGKIYGMPTNVDSLRLYYNLDLLSAALGEYRTSLGDNVSDEVYQPVRQLLSRPPSTWTELLEQEKYITQRNGTSITRSTIALGTADNIPNSAEILQLLMLQNGIKIVGTDRKNAIFHLFETTPSGTRVRPGERALDFYTSFANPAKDNYTWNPSMPSVLDAFGQGKLAMVVAFSDFEQQVKIKYPSLGFEKTAVPQISISEKPVNFLRLKVELVTQTADNLVAAFAMLKEYTSESNSSLLASEQRLKSPYLSFLNKEPDETFNEQVLTGQGVYKKSHTQFDAAFRQMIVDTTQNNVPVNLALDAGAERINQLLTPPTEE